MSDKKKIVVLGGSFNPPTKAHKELITAAMQAVGATRGVFVPSSDAYVARKVRRSANAQLFSEQDRQRMLEAMCDHTLSVGTYEFSDTSNGRTLLTLRQVQDDHPSNEVWFILGSDKIPIFHKWKTAEIILTEFNVLWVGRDGQDARKQAEASPLLSAHMDHQAFMSAPDDTNGISSSRFWAGLVDGDDAAYENLHPDVRGLVESILNKR